MKIHEIAVPNDRVLVMGGSFIGVEVSVAFSSLARRWWRSFRNLACGDFVIIEIGIKINSDFAVGSGLHIHQDGTIPVNVYLQTAHPDICAAVYITSWPDPNLDDRLHDAAHI